MKTSEQGTQNHTNRQLFDTVVGNPPYQKTNNTINQQIWPLFVDWANLFGEQSTLIHPGRWVIPKKNMVPVRDHLVDSGLVFFDYYQKSKNVFPTIAIGGGITITYFKHGYHDRITYSVTEGEYRKYSENEQIFTNKAEEEAFNKITKNYADTMEPLVIGNQGAQGSSEFGYDKEKHIKLLQDSPDKMSFPIKIWANRGYGRNSQFRWYYIEKNKLNKIPERVLSTRKVMLNKKGNSPAYRRQGNVINSQPVIVGRNTIGNVVLFVLPHNDSDYELKLIQSLFKTRTARFLMSITQKDLYVRGFGNIPDYKYFIKELNGNLFTDEFFYKKFNFSEELIAHIEKHISPKN